MQEKNVSFLIDTAHPRLNIPGQDCTLICRLINLALCSKGSSTEKKEYECPKTEVKNLNSKRGGRRASCRGLLDGFSNDQGSEAQCEFLHGVKFSGVFLTSGLLPSTGGSDMDRDEIESDRRGNISPGRQRDNEQKLIFSHEGKTF